MKTSPGENMDEFKKLQYVYLEEVEQLFGPKTEYQYGVCLTGEEDQGWSCLKSTL